MYKFVVIDRVRRHGFDVDIDTGKQAKEREASEASPSEEEDAQAAMNLDDLDGGIVNLSDSPHEGPPQGNRQGNIIAL